MPGPSGLTEEEHALLKCQNMKEALAYEHKLKNIISSSLKRFQHGQDPDPRNIYIKEVYPCMVQEMKMLVRTMYDPVQRVKRSAIVGTVMNPDSACWDPTVLDEDDDDDAEADVQIQKEEGVPPPPD